MNIPEAPEFKETFIPHPKRKGKNLTVWPKGWHEFTDIDDKKIYFKFPFAVEQVESVEACSEFWHIGYPLSEANKEAVEGVIAAGKGTKACLYTIVTPGHLGVIVTKILTE